MTKLTLPDDLTEGRTTKVIYQIYPPTFADSNGDGIGDLPGITKKLGYIAHLAVDAIMLGPVHPTPEDPAKSDGGYAVSNHRGIHSRYGTLDDFDALVSTASQKGLGVIMDPVICHTSTDHEWFEKSRNRVEPFTTQYVWHPGIEWETGDKWTSESKGTRVEPNNWLSCFGGTAWELDPVRNEYYWHPFSKYQPALNLGDERVQDMLFEELKFLKNRNTGNGNQNGNHDNKTGVIGIRVDAAPFAVSDPEFRNDEWLDKKWPRGGRELELWKDQDLKYSLGQPGAVKFYERMRKAFGDDFYLLGEVIAGQEGGRNGLPIAATYKALDCCYTDLSTPFVFDPANELRNKSAVNQRLFPNDEYCVGTGTHDIPRMASRLEWLPGGDLRAVALRQEMVRLFCEPGDKILYNGDELGLTQAKIPESLRKDLANAENRDGERTPFVFHSTPWRAGGKNGGFSTSSQPWLPVPEEHLPLAAAAQEHCERSNLHFMIDLIRWRRDQPAMVKGRTFYLDNGGDIYGFVRATPDQTMLFLFNRSDGHRSIELADYLSDQVIQKLGLQQTNIQMGPYGTSIAEARSAPAIPHAAPERPAAAAALTGHHKKHIGARFEQSNIHMMQPRVQAHVHVANVG